MTRVRQTIKSRVENAEAIPLDVDALLKDGCFNSREAVAFAGLSISQLTTHMDSGVLPYVRDGKARRIPKVALRLFLKNRLVRRNDLEVRA